MRRLASAGIGKLDPLAVEFTLEPAASAMRLTIVRRSCTIRSAAHIPEHALAGMSMPGGRRRIACVLPCEAHLCYRAVKSRGFEGMAINPDRTRLYLLLEGPLVDDPIRTRLLIQEFDLATKKYSGNYLHLPKPLNLVK